MTSSIETIQSPMSGRVIKLHVLPGESFEAGDALLTLECMKMEIPVECEYSGELVSMRMSIGDDVAEGDVIGSFRQRP